MTQFWQPTTASIVDHLPSKKAQNGLLQAVARHEARLSVLDREISPRQLAQHTDTALSSLPATLEASLEQTNIVVSSLMGTTAAGYDDTALKKKVAELGVHFAPMQTRCRTPSLHIASRREQPASWV